MTGSSLTMPSRDPVTLDPVTGPALRGSSVSPPPMPARIWWGLFGCREFDFYTRVQFPIYAIMLYLVGLGLADETDITVRGLEVVKKAERVYLEAYTSILLVNKEKLVSVFGDRIRGRNWTSF